jgi:hypothetical protein
MYQDLERDWPERRQPVVHCLRHLADLAFERDDRSEAERYWREAIARGESYLEQYPQNTDARANVCWACADLCDSILIVGTKGELEVASILKKGLRHVEIMREADRDSGQARQVGAYLKFCLAQFSSRDGRIDNAIATFAQAIEEIETLCGQFPWDRTHWELARHFHQSCVSDLQRSQRPEDAARFVQRFGNWLDSIARNLPHDPIPQAELERCRTRLTSLRESIDAERERPT